MAVETGHFLLRGEPIPSDALAVRFRAVERISHPYEVVVDFTTADRSFDVSSCLRAQLTLHVVDARGHERLFDGVVDQADFLDIVAERMFFRVRLRPALAALAHRRGCRIFQEKSIVQIAHTLFEEAGFSDRVEWLTTKKYEPREFTVQYRESELSFVSRLFEEYGLFYWFGHGADGHRMVISDDASAFSPQDDTPMTAFTMTQGVAVGSEPLASFRRKRALRTTDVHLVDYDFEKPGVKPEAQQPGEDALPAPYFEYPGRFVDTAVGKQLAGARMRSLRTDADVVEGESLAIGLRCGVPFTVDGAAEADLNGTFVVTDLVTVGRQNTDDGSVATENQFRGIPANMPWAPERRARRPRIHGVQTAVVTGSSEQAQAIHVDEYGRIKVRFFWDRESPQDHTSSCWMRVSQVALGGGIILPRVGWEVSVAFLDGDPDRPLVLGRVYNGEKVPPYALPTAKASGALKTWSSPGEGGYNELNLSDSAGSQGFSMHAQKDLNVTVNNDKNETVAVNDSHHVSVNESTSVGANESVTVGANQSVDVGASLTQNIGGAQTIEIGGNDVTNATANYVEKIDGDRSYEISGQQITIENGVRYEVSGDASRKVGGVQINGSIASINETVTGSYTHNTGAVTVHLVGGSHGENISGSKTQTSTAAELHMTKANIEQSSDAAVTNLIGGLHYQKLGGDLSIKAPMVTMLGGVGILKGGKSELKLGGGPIVGKGKKIAVDGAMLVKMGGQLKMA